MLIDFLHSEILHITSPHCISVRLCSSKDLYCELQESLANTYSGRDCLQYSLSPDESPQPGQSYVVCTPAAWYRSLVITVNKDRDKILVRLVDSGRVVEVSASAL